MIPKLIQGIVFFGGGDSFDSKMKVLEPFLRVENDWRASNRTPSRAHYPPPVSPLRLITILRSYTPRGDMTSASKLSANVLRPKEDPAFCWGGMG